MVVVRQLGQRDYLPVWQAMQSFTDNRNSESSDEIWLVEHQAVFTQGQAGKAEHLLAPGDIPVVKVDRGGQVTYHGPGQQVMYVLFNLKRLNIGVRQLVSALEQCVIALMHDYNISAYARPDAPGVYVDGAKLCSLGLRIRKGCSFHGLALNVDMDLSPFQRINPCGYANMQMIDSKTLGGPSDLQLVGERLVDHLVSTLSIDKVNRQVGFND